MIKLQDGVYVAPEHIVSIACRQPGLIVIDLVNGQTFSLSFEIISETTAAAAALVEQVKAAKAEPMNLARAALQIMARAAE